MSRERCNFCKIQLKQREHICQNYEDNMKIIVRIHHKKKNKNTFTGPLNSVEVPLLPVPAPTAAHTHTSFTCLNETDTENALLCFRPSEGSASEREVQIEGNSRKL